MNLFIINTPYCDPNLPGIAPKAGYSFNAIHIEFSVIFFLLSKFSEKSYNCDSKHCLAGNSLIHFERIQADKYPRILKQTAKMEKFLSMNCVYL